MEAILIIVVLVLFIVVVGVIQLRQRKKQETEELQKLRQTLNLTLFERSRNIRRNDDPKFQVLQHPTMADYVPISETPVSVDLPLPKVTSNIYFVGIKANLRSETRGILYARFSDLKRCFIDIELFDCITAEMMHYWFPSNSFFEGEPAEFYAQIVEALTDDKSHMYIIRYDSVKGFLMCDLFADSAIEVYRRMSSYVLYMANGFSAPTPQFYASETVFTTTAKPIVFPQKPKPEPEEHDSGIRFSIAEGEPDLDFSIQPRRQSSDSFLSHSRNNLESLLSGVEHKIELPTTDVKYTEEVKKMLSETLENIQKLQLNGVTLDIIQELIGKTTRLSELRITRHHKVVLTDFGNLEIKLNPLQTTVYLFFLNHPEGVSFYELQDHKEELMSIYGRITGRSDVEAIKRSINDLVDRFNGSISIQCSRIRKAFITVLSEDIAKNYYIDGKQGEAKSIAISRSYVRRDDLGSGSINFDSPIAQKGKVFMDLVEGSNFKTFGNLAFLLRPLSNMQFRKGYVPDAFWCGTDSDRYLKIYACREGSKSRYCESDGSERIPEYNDAMYLDGIYSRRQCEQIPPVSEYTTANDALGVWEAYLLSNVETLLPALKGASAERRRYVMSHRDLVEILGATAADRFKTDARLLPNVTGKDGTYSITCCYASSKINGLCKETITAVTTESSVRFKTEHLEILEQF